MLSGFHIIGSDLVSLMWDLLVSYFCICALYLYALKTSNLRILQTTMQPQFIVPLLIVLSLLLGGEFLIQQQGFGALIAVPLSLLLGIASLLLMIFLHGECRGAILGWLRARE
jgi:hypothetical protein